MALSISKTGASKRKRHRAPSLDAEIRNAAKQIVKSGMAEAMKAGSLIVVSRKLDLYIAGLNEIRAILQAAGFVGVGALANHVQPMAGAAISVGGQQPVANPCVHCGRPGVRRSRPNQFNPTGSWFCATHASLAGRIEQEDRMDAALIGSAPPMNEQRKPVLVQTQVPAVMRPQVKQPAPPEPEPVPELQPESPADPLKAAMSSLGV